MYRRIAALSAVVSVLALAVSGPAQATAATAAACPTGWGSTAGHAGTLSTSPLTAAVTGQHACFDRIVFTFRGRARGYDVRYTSNAHSEGEGAPLHINGGAKIAVSLFAPSYDLNGRPTYNHPVDSKVANVRGYRTLRDLVYGGSFEGYSTFGIGTRARLPFRVWTMDGPGSSSRVVIDIKHAW